MTGKISPLQDLFYIGADSRNVPLSAELAGSKAAILSTIAALGLPVPPAFVLSTRVCAALNEGANIKSALSNMLVSGIQSLERVTGRGFGDSRRPLFVSVRSGAARSMPGMLSTILNVGMNADTVRGLIRISGNPRLAWDSYRRFVAEYAETVCGAERQPFQEKVDALIRAEGASSEADLDPVALEKLTLDYLALAEELDSAIPSDPMKQLRAAALAVFASWQAPKAIEYRRLNRLEALTGTAVTVQTMVFGNSGSRSGAGVAFTRNPGTGEKGLYVDFLLDAQGEDVVSGRRTPGDVASLRLRMPEIEAALTDGANRLERELKDMQDVEFTVEEGKLYFLQSRAGKRTPRAALAILVDLVREGIIDEAEGAKRAAEIDLNAVSVTRFEGNPVPIAVGTPASVGVACGRAVFSNERARALAADKEPVILVRPDISTNDIAGLAVSAGVLTAVGGKTAHAAVVARQLGKVCIVGCNTLSVDESSRSAILGDEPLREGDWLSLNGETGEIFRGALTIVSEKPEDALAEIRAWQERAAAQSASSSCHSK